MRDVKSSIGPRERVVSIDRNNGDGGFWATQMLQAADAIS
jgi:hypothetical protein